MHRPPRRRLLVLFQHPTVLNPLPVCVVVWFASHYSGLFFASAQPTRRPFRERRKEGGVSCWTAWPLCGGFAAGYKCVADDMGGGSDQQPFKSKGPGMPCTHRCGRRPIAGGPSIENGSGLFRTVRPLAIVAIPSPDAKRSAGRGAAGELSRISLRTAGPTSSVCRFVASANPPNSRQRWMDPTARPGRSQAPQNDGSTPLAPKADDAFFAALASSEMKNQAASGVGAAVAEQRLPRWTGRRRDPSPLSMNRSRRRVHTP